MIVAQMSFADVKALAGNMLEDHFKEIGFNGLGDEGLSVWDEYYQSLESMGRLVVVAAVSGNKLCGYVSAAISPHPHHKHLNFAMTDTVYLSPEYRKSLSSGRIVCRMIRLVEARAKELGASYFQLVSNYNYSIDNLADHLGFVISDVVYCKRIE